MVQGGEQRDHLTPIDLTQARILVTGGGGVLGRALQAVLAGRSPAALLAPSRRECDLLDDSAVQRTFDAFQPTLVFHLAGWVAGVAGNLAFAGQAFYENSRINLNVIEASRRARVTKVVAAGTTAIYADGLELPMREGDVWTGAPHGSEAAYAHAKRAMLAHLEAYRVQYGLDYGYAIFTNLYGPHDRFDERFGHVVPSLVARFHRVTQAREPSLTVWGDGTPTRDFLYAEDAARAAVAIAERGSGAYNVASGSAVTIRSLVERLQAASGYEGELVWDIAKPNGQLARAYDISRLRGLGWAPEIELDEGLRRTMNWYRGAVATARR